MNAYAEQAGSSSVVQRGATVSRQTESILREMVLNGTLAPGERLNEVTIADRLGVSRGPLREAIQKLAGEGLLQLESHRGAFVRKYEPREIIETYEMRIALELYAVRLVIERASDDDLEALGILLAESSAAAEEARAGGGTPAPGPYVAELDFHQRMVSLSENSAIVAASLEVNHRLFLALTHTERSQVRRQHSSSEHQEVLVAVRRRDTATATALLEDHLEISMQNTLAVLGLDPLEYPQAHGPAVHGSKNVLKTEV
ncbi:GntR family transcriptional regulator [Salinibacterium sp. ZJ454]|uniref:GntR family transcriptional regulator n=1 Tax=Salinibacterium sp. ZJ454 TaxID=2708339 RepID=UPI0024440B3B|nr:GntR family transcriptional regulator [Salinibacterium sp. ZJ454]